eukprot:CAMPEP_0195285416 /NCGR_PEP_ID=MMETSP0707-20130614/3259_1 /TAXON_ID=33640 /ORGANISM="Asterionellopsis glacialis, Strain CCMP134" /LENGTH=171 /DNA_ID=CAMNT_0040344905 /DNA_START=189 /DNA_END=701 /DNA_ORIENTATION=-
MARRRFFGDVVISLVGLVLVLVGSVYLPTAMAGSASPSSATAPNSQSHGKNAPFFKLDEDTASTAFCTRTRRSNVSPSRWTTTSCIPGPIRMRGGGTDKLDATITTENENQPKQPKPDWLDIDRETLQSYLSIASQRHKQAVKAAREAYYYSSSSSSNTTLLVFGLKIFLK